MVVGALTCRTYPVSSLSASAGRRRSLTASGKRLASYTQEMTALGRALPEPVATTETIQAV